MANQSLLLSRSAGRRFQKQVKEYDALLRNTCETLAAQAASGKEMSPAAAWLLDNYLFVHGQAQTVGLDIPPGFFSKLPRASGEAGGEWPRAAVVADAIVNASDGALTSEAIRIYLRTYQRSTPLTLAELWALEALLKLVLIRRLCQWIAAGLTDSPESEAAVRNSIGSLRKMEALQWREVVEAACLAERILREDPAGVYDRMDFATRDRYRREVEQLARGSWYREERVAEIVLEMAREEAGARGRRTRESHVGYFLIGAGRDRLKSRLGYRRGAEEVICDLVRGAPNFFYIGAVAVITSLLVLAAARVLRPMPWWFALLLAIPASQGAISVVNHLVSLIIRPQKLPRMDFSDGIPPSCRTFVVVPTLLLSRAEALKLLERLEIHYLASRDPNLLFALLTDF
ncbi:MAG TPA: hypothetical protein VG672_00160, partial [Bryobacteraceae bacterium]|nr:hypothetical protein [Bryobacteraceae bacterium]